LEDSEFNYTFASDLFTDIDEGDILTYSANLETGKNLPTWLTFNSETRTFAGTPNNDNVGIYNIKLIATDTYNASDSLNFTIEVINVNDAPTVNIEIPNQTINQFDVYEYEIPSNVFNDIDLGDNLTLTAMLSGNTTLPVWLSFDNINNTFTGVAQEYGEYSIEVTATDIVGAKISSNFILSVTKPSNVSDVSTVESSVYPNPTSGKLIVTGSKSEYKITVKTLEGLILKQINSKSENTTIDISIFASGIYFIEVKTGDKVKSHRIVLIK